MQRLMILSTVSNYLPLVGGTLTGQLQLDNLGIRFEASPTHPGCSTGVYAIFADSVTGEMRKCTNGILSNLDTVGGAASDVTTAVSLATCRYVGDTSFGRCEWAAGGEVYSAAVNAAKTTIYTSDIFMGTEDMHIRNAALDACATFDSTTGLLTFNTTGTCERPMISRPFDASAFNAGTSVTRESVSLNGWPASPILIGPDSDAGTFAMTIESLWNDYIAAGSITIQLNCHSITAQSGILVTRVGAAVCLASGEALPAFVAPVGGSLLTCTFTNTAREVQKSNTVTLTTTGCAAGEQLSLPFVTEADTTVTWSASAAFITGGLLKYESAGANQ